MQTRDKSENEEREMGGQRVRKIVKETDARKGEETGRERREGKEKEERDEIERMGRGKRQRTEGERVRRERAESERA